MTLLFLRLNLTEAQNTIQNTENLDNPSFEVILNALMSSVLVLNQNDQITYVNVAFENLFSRSKKKLIGLYLKNIFSGDSQILSLVRQARGEAISLTEFNVNFLDSVQNKRKTDIHISHMVEKEGFILLTFQEKTSNSKFHDKQNREGASKTIIGMASILAHEIKNPLSGIRGSAQLLGYDLSEEDQKLTQIIIEETDRICALVDQMEVFSEHLPVKQDSVNIHSVLQHVKELAKNGFAKNIKFIEKYDPSLPDTLGDKGKLIQVFLNLIKNAAEACSKNGEITILTAYRYGVKKLSADGKEKTHLPLEISIIDNGEGFSEEMEDHLFDPFITTKEHGTGLGLSLVAKIIADHDGMVECESSGDKTIFRILLKSI